MKILRITATAIVENLKSFKGRGGQFINQTEARKKCEKKSQKNLQIFTDSEKFSVKKSRGMLAGICAQEKKVEKRRFVSPEG